MLLRLLKAQFKDQGRVDPIHLKYIRRISRGTTNIHGNDAHDSNESLT